MKPRNGLHWLVRYHFKYPLRTFYTYLTAIIELLLFTYPIQISAKIISGVISGGVTSEIKGDLLNLLGLAGIQVVIFFSISFINEILAHRITTDMTQEFFESLQYRSLTYHDKQDVGNLMAMATGDTRTINIALSPATRFQLSVLTIWVLNLINAFRVHWSLGVVGIIIVIIFYITTLRFAQQLAPLASTTREQFSEVTQTTTSSLEGIREIKGFRSEFWAKRRFIKSSKSLLKAEIREGRKSAWFYPQLLVTLYAAVLLSLSLFFASQNTNPALPNVTLEQVMINSGYVLMMLGHSEELDWAMSFIVRAKASADRLYKIIFGKDKGEFLEGNKSLKDISTTLEFKNVSFRYDDTEHYVLQNVSFSIRENETFAIVGGPGSGKTTLTKLIQRLYLPSEGEILVGGHPITEFTNDSLRKTISTVEQDIFLFNDSVMENIRFGKPDASEEEVIKAAKYAEAHDFIMEMPETYKTLIGERGVRLSGGQAQRISIARALLMNPKILIMDDAAAALDAKTEIKIQKAITEILKTRTTIITTHRLAIISKSNVVIILDKGKVVGIGPHEHLIRTNQFYRRLFERHYELPPLENSLMNSEVAQQ